MDKSYSIFWGDTHHNTYQHSIQDPPLADLVDFASKYLDFYTGAYYTAIFNRVPPRQKPKFRGIDIEEFKDQAAIAREWEEVQAVTTDWNHPGEFVAFPGYEWQGNGSWGDFNVVYKHEGHPVYTVNTIAELYSRLKGLDAIAIPHHTGYRVGQRAPVWAACDDSISPFAELFSIHGCSETDEEWIGLRHNSHMGPGVGGGTYQEALDRGLHIGVICSTDNWTNMPGHWGHGLMACYARELSRESLWEAFLARRVYGVTGDRIRLEFTCNGAQMGSVMTWTPKREISVSIRGSDAIDRIEVLRNGRVIASHCHQGTWDLPPDGRKTYFKFRIEPGWGPRLGDLPFAERHWDGTLSVAGARMLGWEPCWVTRGHSVPTLSDNTAHFVMVSCQEQVSKPMQGAVVFEFEADPSAELILCMNDLEERGSVRDFMMRSRIMWYRDECIKMVREATGLEQNDGRRGDEYYQQAFKAKLHRVIPESGYTAILEITDDEPLNGETNYRVRVEQRNGQRAWSSPIWVRPK